MEFKDIKNFIEGSFNHLLDDFNLQDEESKKLAEKRIQICLKCPKLVDNKCSECGCKFPSLVWAKGKSCPIGKW